MEGRDVGFDKYGTKRSANTVIIDRKRIQFDLSHHSVYNDDSPDEKAGLHCQDHRAQWPSPVEPLESACSIENRM